MTAREVYTNYYSKHYDLSFDSFKRQLKRWKKKNKEVNNIPENKDKHNLNLIETLKKGIDIKELSEKLNISVKTCESVIEDIKSQGYNVLQAGNEIKISNIIVPTDNRIEHKWNGDKIIRFGLMGDTQINSKYTQLTHLHKFYDICKAEGIDTVYHTGDIDEGEQMRPGHQYECYEQGADDHVKEIVRVYPKREGITTYFITGNHDASIIRRCGYDIGYPIAAQRDDMKYLGQLSAVIDLTPNCTLELRHPIDGTCFDDKTEILTKRGWVFFNELTQEDNVATMTKNEHEFQWQNPEFITKQHYKGYLYHIKSRTIDMMITPNHGLWVRRSKAGLGWKENLEMPAKSHRNHNTDWHMETAEEVCEKQYCRQRWQMTNKCDKWQGEILSNTYKVPFIESKNKGMEKRMLHIGEVDLIDFCELVAWYVTEGHADKKRVSICQDKKINPDNHKLITDLLERMNIPYAIEGRNDKDIVIRSVELSKYLTDICGNGSREKYIPSFLKELPIKYLRVMFDTMILGDGWINGKSHGYKSISKQLRTDIMEIAIKLGYGVSEYKDTVHITTIQTQPTITIKPEKVEYDGMVYCCKVPNELILVRRNGKATWSHNSYALSYKLQKMVEAMSGGEKPNILACGHYHKSEYFFYRNVHIFQTSSFQAQTPWMKGKGIATSIGGWIVEINADNEGTITRIKQEYIPFYKAIKDDYKNWRDF